MLRNCAEAIAIMPKMAISRPANVLNEDPTSDGAFDAVLPGKQPRGSCLAMQECLSGVMPFGSHAFWER
jgi:hypothetical protein